jgi:class 3 adenylate cyclase
MGHTADAFQFSGSISGSNRLPGNRGCTIPGGQTLQGGSAVAKNTRRKLAVILVADMVGYSQLTGAEETRPLKRL